MSDLAWPNEGKMGFQRTVLIREDLAQARGILMILLRPGKLIARD